MEDEVSRSTEATLCQLITQLQEELATVKANQQSEPHDAKDKDSTVEESGNGNALVQGYPTWLEDIGPETDFTTSTPANGLTVKVKTNIKKVAGTIEKLKRSSSAFYTWSEMLQDALDDLPNAYSILTGEDVMYKPYGANYNKDINTFLSTIIRFTVDNSDNNGNVKDIIERVPQDDRRKGSALYRALKNTLTIGDMAMAHQIKKELMQLQLETTVEALGERINKLAISGERAGVTITEQDQKEALLSACEEDPCLAMKVCSIEAGNNPAHQSYQGALSFLATQDRKYAKDEDARLGHSKKGTLVPVHTANTIKSKSKSGSKSKNSNITCRYCHQRGHYTCDCDDPNFDINIFNHAKAKYEERECRNRDCKSSKGKGKSYGKNKPRKEDCKAQKASVDSNSDYSSANEASSNSTSNSSSDSVSHQLHHAMCSSLSSKRSDAWILDTGATAHMSNKAASFLKLASSTSTVTLADGGKTDIKGVGTIYLPVKQDSGLTKHLILRRCLYVPGLGDNLISGPQLT
ncbi:hypothetical protein ACQY0O_004823 [Thecaphora frezii]